MQMRNKSVGRRGRRGNGGEERRRRKGKDSRLRLVRVVLWILWRMAYLVSRWSVLDSLSCVDSFVVIGIGKGTKKLGTFLDCTVNSMHTILKF